MIRKALILFAATAMTSVFAMSCSNQPAANRSSMNDRHGESPAETFGSFAVSSTVDSEDPVLAAKSSESEKTQANTTETVDNQGQPAEGDTAGTNRSSGSGAVSQQTATTENQEASNDASLGAGSSGFGH